MIFSTARLIARRFQPGDLEPFVAMRSDPEVARYQGWGDYTHDHGRLFLAEMAERAPGQAGWFQFALIDKATGRFIGDCGLDIHACDPEQGRIGYTVARPFWNRGLATEAVAALTAYAFANHALGCISASTDPAMPPPAGCLKRQATRSGAASATAAGMMANGVRIFSI